MVRFQVGFTTIEATVLTKWAESEFRDPRDQIHYIVKLELERQGLLPETQPSRPIALLQPLNNKPGGNSENETN